MATERISAELYEREYRVVSVLAPTTAKDWNEALIRKQMAEEKAQAPADELTLAIEFSQ